MDAGNIVKSSPVSVSPNETGGQLYTKLKFQAALTLDEFIQDIINNKIEETTQDEDKVSFAPTLNKDNGHLKFAEHNYQQLHNKVRALKPWPGTFCFLNDKRLKILEIEKYALNKLEPGQISLNENMLLVGCTDSTVRLVRIQLEGKKAASDKDFVNGLLNSKTQEFNIK